MEVARPPDDARQIRLAAARPKFPVKPVYVNVVQALVGVCVCLPAFT